MDIYIKADSEASLWSALESAGLVDAERNPTVSLDIIGTIYKQVDAETVEAVEGYHANVRGELTDAQIAALPTVPAPVTPFRVWA